MNGAGRGALIALTVLLAACSDRITTTDLAGRWTIEVRPMDRDTVILTGEMVAEGDPLTFTQHYPGRAPLAFAVTVDGDSVMTLAGPYPSHLRPEVMVTTAGVYRRNGDGWAGVTTARYAPAAADSVSRFRAAWVPAAPR